MSKLNYNFLVISPGKYGAFIRNRRKELHISQQALASALECTPQAVSKYENDKAAIYLGMIGVLARALQVDITSFLHCVAEKNNNLADDFTFDRQNFRDNLLFLREERHMTQKVFSEKIGIPVFKITKWENGKALPSLPEFMKLADFYSLTYEALYFGKIPEPEGRQDNKPMAEKPVKDRHRSSLSKWIVGLSVGFGVAILVALSVTLPLIMPPKSSSSSSSVTPPDITSTSTSESGVSSSSDQPPIAIDSVVIVPDPGN